MLLHVQIRRLGSADGAQNNGACPRAMDVFTASEMRDLLDE